LETGRQLRTSFKLTEKRVGAVKVRSKLMKRKRPGMWRGTKFGSRRGTHIKEHFRADSATDRCTQTRSTTERGKERNPKDDVANNRAIGAPKWSQGGQRAGRPSGGIKTVDG